MSELKLSQINDENLIDEQIDNIVYSNVEDDGLSSDTVLFLEIVY